MNKELKDSYYIHPDKTVTIRVNGQEVNITEDEILDISNKLAEQPLDDDEEYISPHSKVNIKV